MESVSRSSGDEDELLRAPPSSQRMELSGNLEGKNSEQKPSTPTTPRSKHSATEQRRRCKINDRFQILRELLPHNDQKRDKASFLLEVIEYVKFLQEKVQKYESCTGWSQEHEKLVPWIGALSDNHNQGLADGGISDPQIAKNGPTNPGFFFGGKFVDNSSIPMSSTSLANIQSYINTGASSMLATMQANYYASVGRDSGVTQVTERLISDSDILVSHPQSDWQRSSSAADCTASSDMMNEQEELAIDEGTISISSAYSQELLNALAHALASSGLDMSLASISVQVNLGRRANRISSANFPVNCENLSGNPSLSANKEMGESRNISNREGFEPSAKRRSCCLKQEFKN